MSSHPYFGENWVEILRTYGYAIISLALIIWGLSMLWFLWKRKLNLSPGPNGLPLVGYLPFLGKEPFKTLDNLSKKYGNVFSLYLGRKYVVILGDSSAVKEAFSKPGTLDRPPGVFDFQPDGFGMTSSNGEKWVQIRRFIIRTMRDLGLGRSAWESLVEDEVSDFLKLISDQKGVPVDIEKPLMSSVSNNITSLVFGKRLPPGPRREMLNSSIDSIMVFFKQSGLWNYFPWLCTIVVKLRIGSYYKLFSEMYALNAFVRNEIEMHKSRDFSEENDFVSNFIKAMESKQGNQKDEIFNDKNLIGNCQSLFAAGSETVKTSLMWLFLAMTAYSDIQRKVHLELDSFLRKQRRALWEERFKLPYTYAVILEAQRWKTLVPLNLVRMASEDVNICGYDVTKGSLIMANIWALHNDHRYWKEPEKFIPERFLQNEGKDVNLKLESYMPFSYGRRRCPGDNVAMMEIFLYFTAIMQQFEIIVPHGGKPNLDAIIGITYIPLHQELCFIPR